MSKKHLRERKEKNRLCVAVLEVMWDWRGMTSRVTREAPPFFHINPANKTGGVLYGWVGHKGDRFTDFIVTNACPQLVYAATERGIPSVTWLHTNLTKLQPIDTLLVCGKVAQKTFLTETEIYHPQNERILLLPHPAARMWTNKNRDKVGRMIREGEGDYRVSFSKASGLKIEEI